MNKNNKGINFIKNDLEKMSNQNLLKIYEKLKNEILSALQGKRRTRGFGKISPNYVSEFFELTINEIKKRTWQWIIYMQY